MMQRRGRGAAAPQPVSQTYKGLQPGEHIIYRGRPHWLYLLVGSWRIVIIGFGLTALIMIGHGLAMLAPALPLALVVLFILCCLPFVRWFLNDLNVWLFRSYILTDWRVIDVFGTSVTGELRDQAPLERIQQVRVNRANPVAAWLDIGEIDIITAGNKGDIKLNGVRHPRELARMISVAQVNRVPVGPKPVEILNPALRAMWDKLEQPDETPLPTSPLGRLTPAGWVPPRNVPLALLNGEQVLDVYHRHWFALLLREVKPICVVLVGLVIAVLSTLFGNPRAGSEPVVIVLACWFIAFVWGLGVYLNFIDDVLLLTTHRLVDIDRLFFVFSETRKEVRYSKVQDVQVDMPLVGQIFGYGTILVETAGRIDNIEMNYIPKPLAIQDRIQAFSTAASERTEMTMRKIRYRQEFRRWMANVLNELVIQIPDVRGLAMLDAARVLRDAGLRLVVVAERPDPATPPGTVLEQVPHDGTTAVRGNEVRVILSRHAAPVGGRARARP